MSFIFQDVKNELIFVYKDIFGKRSLILQFSENEICFSNTFVFGTETKTAHFEMPSNCLMVFKTENGKILDLVKIVQKCSKNEVS